jgi:hypothetical protein
MRQIHPVGLHEKFVASGVYTYYHENNPTGSEERWSIHELPDSAQLIRVEQNWASGNPRIILIEAWRGSVENVGGQIERLDILGFRRDGKKGKATYLLESNPVRVSYIVDDMLHQDEVDLPTNCVLSTNSTLFLGFTLAKAVRELGQCVPVCKCWPFLSFDAKVETLGAVIRETEVVTIAGKSVRAQGYLLNYPCSSATQEENVDLEKQPLVWLDEHHIVLKSESSPGIVTVLLTQYARRPEPPKS